MMPQLPRSMQCCALVTDVSTAPECIKQQTKHWLSYIGPQSGVDKHFGGWSQRFGPRRRNTLLMSFGTFTSLDIGRALRLRILSGCCATDSIREVLIADWRFGQLWSSIV